VHAGATLEFIFPDAGFLLELDTIAACMIGGASLMGGTVIGACLSTLLMDATLPIETRVSNILSLMTVKENIDDLDTVPSFPRLEIRGAGHVEGLHGLTGAVQARGVDIRRWKEMSRTHPYPSRSFRKLSVWVKPGTLL
jgi:hypothetical protein